MKLRKQGNETIIAIPKDTIRFMGWKMGDKIIINTEKKENTIKIINLEEKKNEN